MLRSTGEYKLPVGIIGKDIYIKTDVVESDISLLPSRSSMEKARVKMDIENDTAIIIGKEVALNMTLSGHYRIPINKTKTVQTAEVNRVKLDEMNIKDSNKQCSNSTVSLHPHQKKTKTNKKQTNKKPPFVPLLKDTKV